jgi:hypothetical protein
MIAGSRTKTETQTPIKPFSMSFTQLTILYSVSILFCGRAGLLLHELIGHGLMAKLLGAQVTQVELHWFGGGSVHFDWASGFPQSYQFVIYFGGIFIELLTAVILFWCCRKRHLWLAQLLAGVLLLHSLFYWATSTQGEFGDGRLLLHYFPLSAPYQVYLLTSLFWLSCFMVTRCLWHWSHALSSRDTLLRHVMFHGGAVIIAVICHGCLSYGEILFLSPSSSAHERVFEPEYSFELAKLRTEYMEEHHKEPDQHWEESKTEELQPWPHYRLFLVLSGLVFGSFSLTRRSQKNFMPNMPSIPLVTLATVLVFMLMWATKLKSS